MYLLFIAGTFAFGQTVQITGTVTSSEDGSTIPGVAIVAKGTTVGVTTNIDGYYTINVPEGTQTLAFSFIGMRSQDVEIANRTTIDVIMEPDLLKVDEVVVIGYGTAKRVGTVVGSVTKVSAEKLADKPSANVFDALQGKVAGVQTYSSSGEPTQLSSVRLHGVGSLGASNTPLYVVDGVPIASSSMLALNSNDFENITVLKDASATSIYGSRAANGVIYITTKSGKRNTKSEITVSSITGFSTLANTDYYENFMNTDELLGFWQDIGYYDQSDVDYVNSNYPNDTKWYKFYYKDRAPINQTNVSITGGNDKTSYFVSGGYMAQDGLAQRSMYKRYTLRSNIDSKVNDWLQMGMNLTGSTDARQSNPYTWNSTNLGLSVLAQPFYTPYDENGDRFWDRTIPGWGRYDPLYLATKLPSDNNRYQMNGMAYILINPMDGLTIRSQAGIDAYHNRGHNKRLPSYVGSLGNGNATENFTSNVIRTITNTIEYKFNINNIHKFTILAGQEGVDAKNQTFSASSTGQTDDRLVLLTAGPDNRDVGHSRSEYAYLSFFGRIDYSLFDKYYLDLSVRQDASSRFGANNQKANFYAVGAMWDLKKESFMDGLGFISSMKAKVSYGTSGNSSIGNYDHLATVGTSQFDSQVGWNISTPGNPDLSWEEQSKFTAGVNFAVMNDQVRFNIEYYSRTTSNQLIDVPYPYTSGFSTVLTNVGAIKNSGIDFEVDFDIIRTGDLFITPYVNFNYNKNEITELFQGKDYWIIPNTGVSWAIGQPVSFFYPMFAGIDPADGAPMWYVPGDDITETTNETTTKSFSPSLEQNTGINRYAPIAGGFGLNAGWKGFTLQADFSYALGKYLIVNDRYFTENPTVFLGFNTSKQSADYWKQADDDTEFPGLAYQFMQFDSRLIENASFMRLKNLTLGYSLPESLTGRTGFLSGARVFATGRNLLTFTNFSGPDPEVDSNLTLGANPNTKQYTFGIELKF